MEGHVLLCTTQVSGSPGCLDECWDVGTIDDSSPMESKVGVEVLLPYESFHKVCTGVSNVTPAHSPHIHLLNIDKSKI